MSEITTIGLDIAKSSFAVHGFDAGGKTVLKKELKRARIMPFFAKLKACRVGLEACASADTVFVGNSFIDFVSGGTQCTSTFAVNDYARLVPAAWSPARQWRK